MNKYRSFERASLRSKLNNHNVLMLWIAASLVGKNMKFEFLIVRDGQLANMDIIVILLLGQYCD